jgi:hypothetical protein
MSLASLAGNASLLRLLLALFSDLGCTASTFVYLFSRPCSCRGSSSRESDRRYVTQWLPLPRSDNIALTVWSALVALHSHTQSFSKRRCKIHFLQSSSVIIVTCLNALPSVSLQAFYLPLLKLCLQPLLLISPAMSSKAIQSAINRVGSVTQQLSSQAPIKQQLRMASGTAHKLNTGTTVISNGNHMLRYQSVLADMYLKGPQCPQ